MVQMNLTVPQPPEISGPVILSAAKDLAADQKPGYRYPNLTFCHPERSEGSRGRLRETLRGVYPGAKRRAQGDPYHCSNGQEPLSKLHLALERNRTYQKNQ